MVKNMVDSEFDLMMLSYGPSGSGKTFNMLGEGGHHALIHKVVQSLIDMKTTVKSISLRAVQAYMGNLYRVIPVSKNITEEKISTDNPNYKVNLDTPKMGLNSFDNADAIKKFVIGMKIYDDDNKNNDAKMYLFNSLLYFLGERRINKFITAPFLIVVNIYIHLN